MSLRLEMVALRAYDALGRQVLNGAGQEAPSQVDLAGLTAGVYVLQAVFADGKAASSRFTVSQ